VLLADLERDPGETHNLRDAQPALVAELRRAAEACRQAIEDRWERDWKPKIETLARPRASSHLADNYLAIILHGILPRLVRRVLVYRGDCRLKTEDGIEVWPLRRFVEVLANGRYGRDRGAARSNRAARSRARAGCSSSLCRRRPRALA
jgi:hypothetical protein